MFCTTLRNHFAKVLTNMLEACKCHALPLETNTTSLYIYIFEKTIYYIFVLVKL